MHINSYQSVTIYYAPSTLSIKQILLTLLHCGRNEDELSQNLPRLHVLLGSRELELEMFLTLKARIFFFNFLKGREGEREGEREGGGRKEEKTLFLFFARIYFLIPGLFWKRAQWFWGKLNLITLLNRLACNIHFECCTEQQEKRQQKTN